ncbi:hypothetical protein M422DRAFT_273904 [Sphaerobolus stellatus SS14]|uniref:Uncharacterized protein n=1 Tax=Sphaerobolus stellatus (strain SS14) TaxID=990650 RepID=A0A0C9UIT0_SPHS4|nr:hypothetical protein M422DRAFT_273904 [Sphaerobolus stellatus SS14]
MIRHEAKQPCSHAGSKRAAYIHLNQRPPAPHKGKRPVTASLQSRLSTHALTPVQTGESSCQWLDEDLDNYNQVRDPVLPYEEEPPSGEPEAGDVAPTMADAHSSLPDENTMDIDQIVDDIYDSSLYMETEGEVRIGHRAEADVVSEDSNNSDEVQEEGSEEGSGEQEEGSEEQEEEVGYA